MLKADELMSPRSCLNKAAPDEPVFVLRAKDPLAPQAVRLWAAMAAGGQHEPEKVDEALKLAALMEDWRNRNCPPPTGPLDNDALSSAAVRQSARRERNY